MNTEGSPIRSGCVWQKKRIQPESCPQFPLCPRGPSGSPQVTHKDVKEGGLKVVVDDLLLQVLLDACVSLEKGDADSSPGRTRSQGCPSSPGIGTARGEGGTWRRSRRSTEGAQLEVPVRIQAAQTLVGTPTGRGRFGRPWGCAEEVTGPLQVDRAGRQGAGSLPLFT